MLTNHKSLEEMINVPIGELAKYGARELCQLQVEADNNLHNSKKIKQWIEAAINMKYENHIKAKRARLQKDTGIVHIEDDGYQISSTVVKKVTWEQEELENIYEEISQNGIDASEYIEKYYHVPELNYINCPANLRTLLDKARILELGKYSYKITKIEGMKWA